MSVSPTLSASIEASAQETGQKYELKLRMKNEKVKNYKGYVEEQFLEY